MSSVAARKWANFDREAHPAAEELAALRNELVELSRNIHSLKGKERGLGHARLSTGWGKVPPPLLKIPIFFVLVELLVCRIFSLVEMPLPFRARLPFCLIDYNIQDSFSNTSGLHTYIFRDTNGLSTWL